MELRITPFKTRGIDNIVFVLETLDVLVKPTLVGIDEETRIEFGALSGIGENRDGSVNPSQPPESNGAFRDHENTQRNHPPSRNIPNRAPKDLAHKD